MPVMLQSGRFAGGGGANSFLGLTQLSTDLSAYTFSTVGIGTAAADRVTVLGVIPSANGGRTITGVTIDGLAMTQSAQSAGTNQGQTCGIFHRLHATGTTADFVVTLNSGCTSCAIAVWSIYSVTVAPVDSGSDIATAGTSLLVPNLAIENGGMVCGVAFKRTGGAFGGGWTGPDGLFASQAMTGDSGFQGMGYYIETSQTTTTDDLTLSWTGSVNACTAVASWGA